jgi:hypothetical protein
MRTIWWLAIPAALLAATAGCACTEAGMEADYGVSCKTAIASQTLHPESAQNLRPVAGMQASESAKVYERYVKSFEKPAGPEPGYIIPVGDQGGGFK